MVLHMNQYTIIYKYGKCTHQLKGSQNIFRQETMVASQNHFTELNEKSLNYFKICLISWGRFK